MAYINVEVIMNKNEEAENPVSSGHHQATKKSNPSAVTLYQS